MGVNSLSGCTVGDIKHCTLIFQGEEMLLEGWLENIYCYQHEILVPVGDSLGFVPMMIRTENCTNRR